MKFPYREEERWERTPRGGRRPVTQGLVGARLALEAMQTSLRRGKAHLRRATDHLARALRCLQQAEDAAAADTTPRPEEERP